MYHACLVALHPGAISRSIALSQKPLGCTANLPGPLRAMKAATPRYASDGSNEYAPQPSGQSLCERIKV